MSFTLKDLQNRDCVELRNGEILIYVDGCFLNHNFAISKTSYLNDLTERKPCESDYDVMRVYRSVLINRASSINEIAQHKNIVFDRTKETVLTWNGLTMKEAHRRMWNDLADGKVKGKGEWFNEWKTEFKSAKEPEGFCFACEEAKHRSINDSYCLNCPIGEWTSESGCLDGLYDKWYYATGFERFKLAHDIANLEWKEK